MAVLVAVDASGTVTDDAAFGTATLLVLATTPAVAGDGVAPDEDEEAATELEVADESVNRFISSTGDVDELDEELL